jgi:hypothetical protein
LPSVNNPSDAGGEHQEKPSLDPTLTKKLARPPSQQERWLKSPHLYYQPYVTRIMVTGDPDKKVRLHLKNDLKPFITYDKKHTSPGGDLGLAPAAPPPSPTQTPKPAARRPRPLYPPGRHSPAPAGTGRDGPRQARCPTLPDKGEGPCLQLPHSVPQVHERLHWVCGPLHCARLLHASLPWEKQFPECSGRRMRPFPPQRAVASAVIGWPWVSGRGISASGASCAPGCGSAVTSLRS